MIIEVEKSLVGLWDESYGVYQRILKLPFILELMEGSLPSQKFDNYMKQDAVYLVDFARALSFIAAKGSNASDIVSFIKFAQAAIVGERELHQYYVNIFGTGESIEKNDACFAYTHYLISTVATQSLEQSVAAVLPCFWIYRDVGRYIYKYATRQNPYWRWIETYADENFSRVVDEALLIGQRMYEGATDGVRASMRSAGLQSAKLEWRFWDDAYKFK